MDGSTPNPQQQLRFPLDPFTVELIKQAVGPISSTSVSINGRSHNNSLTTISSGSGNVPEFLDFQTNDFANGITWGTTASGHAGFTVQTAGKYLVTLTIRYQVANNNGYFSVIAKNGTVTSISESFTDNGNSVGTLCVDILDCAVGDYIDFYAQTSGTLSSTLFNSASQTYCSIAKV